jgi:hypothetical protein
MLIPKFGFKKKEGEDNIGGDTCDTPSSPSPSVLAAIDVRCLLLIN